MGGNATVAGGGGGASVGDPALVTIVSKYDVNDDRKLAAALDASQFIAVESGSCYALVCQCQLREVAARPELYIMRAAHSQHIGLWKIEFQRGRHYVVVGPAMGEQPSVPLIDIMARVERDRHGRDPIYMTPGWSDPLNQRAPSSDDGDPRKVGMPLNPHRAALRVVSVFDILDDWSLSDLLRESRYIALQGDWRRLGAKLSLEPAHRRTGFWLRRYPHVVGVYLGSAERWGEYTFVGPSADNVPQTPLEELLALLRTDLRYTQKLAEEALAPATYRLQGAPPPPLPHHGAAAEAPRWAAAHYLWELCSYYLCWRGAAAAGGATDGSSLRARV